VKLVLAVLALSGCVTTAGLVRPREVSVPLLIGALVADAVVVTVIAANGRDSTGGSAIATGLVVTAADLGVGCLVGACTALHL
jgi:hypothetical protein